MCQQLALSGHGAMSDLSLLCAPNPTSANQHSISSRVRTQGTTDTRATAHSYFAWGCFRDFDSGRWNAAHSASKPHVNALAAVPDYSTGITSTATPSFCLREPTMMPSTGETSEKSRPIARMM